MDAMGKDYCYIMAGGDVMFHPYAAWITPDVKHPTIDNTAGKLVAPVWWQRPQPILQHMIEMEYEGTSKFYLYTPELILSYLTDPVILDFLHSCGISYQVVYGWLGGKNLWKLFQMIIKPMMTTREWPEMIPARKFTGFEYLQQIKTENAKSSQYEIYEKMLATASNGITDGQVVATPIPELIKYLQTPHDHALEATRLLPWQEIKADLRHKKLLEGKNK
jgi:hypothetical protein